MKTTCSVFALMFFGLLCSGTWAAEKQIENLIADFNPDFEQVENGKPVGWRTEWGNVQIDSENPKSGKNALRIEQGGFVVCQKRLTVEPGYKYGMSLYGRLKNFGFIRQKYGCGFGLRELRQDGSPNSNWYHNQHYIKYAEGDSDWEYVSETWVPKETTAFYDVVIHVDALPGSVVWVDDVKVWKEPIEAKSSLRMIDIVENGSFEVCYDGGKMPFGFHIAPPAGFQGDKYDLACVSETVAYDRGASLAIRGEVSVESSAAAFQGRQAVIQLACKRDAVKGKGAFAQAVFLNSQRQVVQTVTLIEDISGSSDWQVFKKDLSDISPDARYVKWVVGSRGMDSGVVYIDDLKLLVPTVYQGLPRKPIDRDAAQVEVDCARPLGKFVSPLNAYDHHCADRVHSWSIGTAGEHLEGPNRWHMKRKDLGVKYVRVHDGFNGNVLCQHLLYDPGYCYYNKHDGNTGISFRALRSNYPIGDAIFPPVCRIDEKSGEMITDFSSIKHYLDNSILKGGMKPIFGLEPVPAAIALESNSHYKPRDMKLWEEFNYRFIKFLLDTYGENEIRQWIFETGNEPGTEPTFHGRPNRTPETVLEDFLEMQDYTVAGCVRAFPDIFIAGPSGPPETFFIPMLEHCAKGVNRATGQIGTKLDAISFHGYLGGTPQDMSWRQSEDQILRMHSYIDYFEKLTGKRLKLFNTEWTPIYHQLTEYRGFTMNAEEDHRQAIGSLHVTYFSYKLGVDMLVYFYYHPFYHSAVRGHFPHLPINQSNYPEFNGKETMISFHGIFKPVCRIFEMVSWLNEMTEVYADTATEPIYAFAAMNDKQVKVICYNFDVNPQARYTTQVKMNVNLDHPVKNVKITRYELSETKANSAYLCQTRRITQADCENNLALVDEINRLSELMPEDLGRQPVQNGKVSLSFDMPAFSASLFVLEW